MSIQNNLSGMTQKEWIREFLSLTDIQWRILSLLEEKKYSRKELASLLHKGTSSIDNMMRRLRLLDLVRTFYKRVARGKRGRAQVFFYLAPVGHLALKAKEKGFALEEVAGAIFTADSDAIH